MHNTCTGLLQLWLAWVKIQETNFVHWIQDQNCQTRAWYTPWHFDFSVHFQVPKIIRVALKTYHHSKFYWLSTFFYYDRNRAKVFADMNTQNLYKIWSFWVKKFVKVGIIGRQKTQGGTCIETPDYNVVWPYIVMSWRMSLFVEPDAQRKLILLTMISLLFHFDRSANYSQAEIRLL